MAPMVLFGLQFTLSLVAYALIGLWYLVPRWPAMSREAALVPLIWVHVFRVIGGSILAPGAVDPAVPADFRELVGYGDMATGLLALVALVALRSRWAGAIAVVWVFAVFGILDTINAVIQSLRYSVFDYPLGVNWVIVTGYVPALVVSTVLIFTLLLAPERTRRSP